MENREDFADDIAEFLFGRNYKKQYKISIFEILRDINKYIPFLFNIFRDLFDFNLIKGFIFQRDGRSSEGISFSNLRKLLKLNIAIFKRMEVINKGEFKIEE